MQNLHASRCTLILSSEIPNQRRIFSAFLTQYICTWWESTVLSLKALHLFILIHLIQSIVSSLYPSSPVRPTQVTILTQLIDSRTGRKEMMLKQKYTILLNMKGSDLPTLSMERVREWRRGNPFKLNENTETNTVLKYICNRLVFAVSSSLISKETYAGIKLYINIRQHPAKRSSRSFSSCRWM